MGEERTRSDVTGYDLQSGPWRGSISCFIVCGLTHGRSQEVRDETKKCPRCRYAWTLWKTDIRYWRRTTFRQTYTRNGEALVAKNSAMKIAHGRRGDTFPLGTPNKAAAITLQ